MNKNSGMGDIWSDLWTNVSKQAETSAQQALQNAQAQIVGGIAQGALSTPGVSSALQAQAEKTATEKLAEFIRANKIVLAILGVVVIGGVYYYAKTRK